MSVRMKALSVQMPWAALIVAGLKPVENRTWPTNVRGRVLIHAGKQMDQDGYGWLLNNWHKHGLPGAVGDILDHLRWGNDKRFGGFIGAVDITACVTSHASPWFSGPFAYVMANAEKFPEFIPYRGQQRFFEVEWPPLKKEGSLL